MVPESVSMTIGLNIAALAFGILLALSLVRSYRQHSSARRREMKRWYVIALVGLAMGCLGCVLVLISELL